MLEELVVEIRHVGHRRRFLLFDGIPLANHRIPIPHDGLPILRCAIAFASDPLQFRLQDCGAADLGVEHALQVLDAGRIGVIGQKESFELFLHIMQLRQQALRLLAGPLVLALQSLCPGEKLDFRFTGEPQILLVLGELVVEIRHGGHHRRFLLCHGIPFPRGAIAIASDPLQLCFQKCGAADLGVEHALQLLDAGRIGVIGQKESLELFLHIMQLRQQALRLLTGPLVLALQSLRPGKQLSFPVSGEP